MEIVLFYLFSVCVVIETTLSDEQLVPILAVRHEKQGQKRYNDVKKSSKIRQHFVKLSDLAIDGQLPSVHVKIESHERFLADLIDQKVVILGFVNEISCDCLLFDNWPKAHVSCDFESTKLNEPINTAPCCERNPVVIVHEVSDWISSRRIVGLIQNIKLDNQ